jgi:hypothetical protein
MCDICERHDLCWTKCRSNRSRFEGLGVSKYETQHKFQLHDEGKVGDFLGIQIEKEGNGTFQLTQTGLIDKVIKAAVLEDYNICATPACTTPVG